MNETCKWINKYRGIYKPMCYAGKGCKACWDKYNKNHSC